MDVPDSPRPEQVELDRTRALTVVWPDGARATFALDDLRLACPCAECRELRDRGEVVWPKAGAPQPIEALGAHLVGAWGLTVEWNDGHATGIYSWGLLRTWAGLDTS
jgi:DUF971 family protein